jgi:hypothetical protein
MPVPPNPAEARPRRHLWSTLKLVFALAILLLVFRAVPWGDTLRLQQGSKVVLAFPGEIVGDWKSESIHFELQGELPAELQDRAPDLGTTLAVTRNRDAWDDPAVNSVDWRPGMTRVFREMDRSGLSLALLLFVLGHLIVATRWWRLLVAAGCGTSWFQCLRLTGLGLFFNIVMPGLMGGDLVKAVLVAREHPGHKADALVSIAVDRLIGLAVMASMAVTAVLLVGSTFAEIRTPLLAFLGALLLGLAVVLSRRLHKLLRLDALLARLPLAGILQRLNGAALVYSKCKRELVIAACFSLGNSVVIVLGTIVLGRAFGDVLLTTASYFAVTPIANMVSAVPLAPGGWGTGEAAFGFLFDMLGASAAVGVATSIAFRLCQMALGLLCSIFLLFPNNPPLQPSEEPS